MLPPIHAARTDTRRECDHVAAYTCKRGHRTEGEALTGRHLYMRPANRRGKHGGHAPPIHATRQLGSVGVAPPIHATPQQDRNNGSNEGRRRESQEGDPRPKPSFTIPRRGSHWNTVERLRECTTLTKSVEDEKLEEGRRQAGRNKSIR